MGFDREKTIFNCGCYLVYYSHDFFNYQKDHRFFNVCGKHPNQKAAMEIQKSPHELGTEQNRAAMEIQKSPQVLGPDQNAPFDKSDDIFTCYDGRCFINLLDNLYVVAKEFNKKMLIHIRHFDETGQNKIPTKKG